MMERLEAVVAIGSALSPPPWSPPLGIEHSYSGHGPPPPKRKNKNAKRGKKLPRHSCLQNPKRTRKRDPAFVWVERAFINEYYYLRKYVMLIEKRMYYSSTTEPKQYI